MRAIGSFGPLKRARQVASPGRRTKPVCLSASEKPRAPGASGKAAVAQYLPAPAPCRSSPGLPAHPPPRAPPLWRPQSSRIPAFRAAPAAAPTRGPPRPFPQARAAAPTPSRPRLDWARAAGHRPARPGLRGKLGGRGWQRGVSARAAAGGGARRGPPYWIRSACEPPPACGADGSSLAEPRARAREAREGGGGWEGEEGSGWSRAAAASGLHAGGTDPSTCASAASLLVWERCP